MTKEQERLFEREVWNWHITENTMEYDIAKDFFEYGLKLGKDDN